MSLAISSVGCAAEDLFRGYRSRTGSYDEMFVSPGVFRPHYRSFTATLAALGPIELARRSEQARQLLRETGVASSAPRDADEVDRPWELDPMPLLLPAAEWSALAAGLAQRARLLSLVLADVYGPQKLLHSGRLPPEAVFAKPGFLRPCHGQHPAGGTFLHFYAADLARTADGGWQVLADHTQAPAGAGHVLENRLVVSRLFPELFQDCQVERLAGFFIALRDSLHRLAPQHRDNPRIVVLSPGQGRPGASEDAYLARYLGYMLVEGGDLAVRDNRVLLKTLGGLLPVDVVLRRVADADCDPLELGAETALGTAGLLQAARGGHVALANPLGSGLAESPAWPPLLNSLCRELLAEDLLLPSAPARQETGAGRRPASRSTAPVWSGGRWETWTLSLRAYATIAGDSYTIMPGGLAKLSGLASPGPDPQSLPPYAAPRPRDASKDVWVLADGPVRHVTLLEPPGQPVELRRSGAELPSRVADNLFWLGRHAERAEGAARLLRTILVRMTSESLSEDSPELGVLLWALAHQGQIEPGFVVEGMRDRLPAIERALPAAVFEEQQPGSLRFNLAALHRAASGVRDRISVDCWRIVRRIDEEFHPPGRRGEVDLAGVLVMLNQMIIDLAAFSGLAMESMTRGQGWRFLDIGRRIERSLHAMGLLQSALVETVEPQGPVLETVLEVADSLMTYRNRYLTTLQAPPVLDLLMTDETNPRSIGFQLAALRDHVEQLPRDARVPLLDDEQRLVMTALDALRLADFPALCQADRYGVRQQLDELLTHLASLIRDLSAGITRRYLVHAAPPRQLA